MQPDPSGAAGLRRRQNLPVEGACVCVCACLHSGPTGSVFVTASGQKRAQEGLEQVTGRAPPGSGPAAVLQPPIRTLIRSLIRTVSPSHPPSVPFAHSQERKRPDRPPKGTRRYPGSGKFRSADSSFGDFLFEQRWRRRTTGVLLSSTFLAGQDEKIYIIYNRIYKYIFAIFVFFGKCSTIKTALYYAHYFSRAFFLVCASPLFGT